MTYAMRTVRPDAAKNPFAVFDSSVREAFVELTGCNPSDEEWEQAQLSLSKAGLGLRSVEKHAAAAFVASRTSTRELCSQVDPAFTCDAGQADSALGLARIALASALPPEK